MNEVTGDKTKENRGLCQLCYLEIGLDLDSINKHAEECEVFKRMPTDNFMDIVLGKNETTQEKIASSKLLAEAVKIVRGDRLEAYGHPRKSFAKIARLWSDILNFEVTSHQVALMMIGLKLIREAHKHKFDNAVDMVGFLLCDELLPDKDK